MENKDEKTFDYYLNKIKAKLEEQDLLIEVQQEVIKLQHAYIVSLLPEDEKPEFDRLKVLL